MPRKPRTTAIEKLIKVSAAICPTTETKINPESSDPAFLFAIDAAIKPLP
jgi:hypothetical protein